MPGYSVNQLTTYRWSFDEDVYYAKRAGFDSIGVWRRKLCDFGLQRAALLLEDSHLRVSCLNWAGGFTGIGLSHDESIRDGLLALRQAEAIGAENLVVYSGGRNNHIDRHADRLLRNALDELLTVAEIAEVVLALKPMHSDCASEWSFQTDLQATLELIAEYDSPHLKMVYDNYQFPEVISSPAIMAELLPHLGLVQLGDARVPHSVDLLRCPLGEGVLPVAQTVFKLHSAGYDGFYDVELMGDEIEAMDYETVLHKARTVIQAGVESPSFSRPNVSPSLQT